MILNNKYYLENFESGEYYEVSKGYYDSYNKMIENFRPKIEGFKGKIIITSVAFENNEFYKNMWLNNN